MKRCELHPLIKTPCYVCNGNDENSGANYYPTRDGFKDPDFICNHGINILDDCYQCGDTERYYQSDNPTIKFKSLQRVLDELRISKETGAFARDQDFYSMLNDLRNSMVNGFETIQSDIREVRKMQFPKRGW